MSSSSPGYREFATLRSSRLEGRAFFSATLRAVYRRYRKVGER